MFKTRFGRWLATLLVFLGCAGLATTASAVHSWGGYHWARADTSTPLKLNLIDNLSGGWKSQDYSGLFGNGGVAIWWNSASTWAPCPDTYVPGNSKDFGRDTSDPNVCPPVGVLALSTVAGNSGYNVRKCPPTSGQVELCNTTYGRTGWLGVAQIWVSGGHITQGTVKLNDTYFNTTTYGSGPWRQFVICQEVGHTFGLDHQDSTFSKDNKDNLGTCMDYTNDPDYFLPGVGNIAGNKRPDFHDFDELSFFIYNHSDSPTTSTASTGSGKMPPGMSRDLSDQAEWGQLVRESYGGRTAVYERDFGGGHKVVTFVIRAQD